MHYYGLQVCEGEEETCVIYYEYMDTACLLIDDSRV